MANHHRVKDRSNAAALAAIVAALTAALAIAGCGSGTTTTVSVGRRAAPPSATGAGAAKQSAPAPATAPTGTLGTSPHSSTAGGQTAAGPSRTAAGPAFTQGQAGSESLTAGLELLRRNGFTAVSEAAYHAGQTLRVLIGTRNSATGGQDQQAFFFDDGRYLGTDTSQPSASIDVVSQSDTEVTLAYSLYRPRDARCCPEGGRASVRFTLDNGSLQALDPIPPVSSSSAPSRQ
jgi:LppP/LprE lipoprotein